MLVLGYRIFHTRRKKIMAFTPTNRKDFLCVLLMLTLLLGVSGPGFALTIDVICGGQSVGSVMVADVQKFPGLNRPGVVGGFFPKQPLTVQGAATACGQDHWNWKQTVTYPPGTPLLNQGLMPKGSACHYLF